MSACFSSSSLCLYTLRRGSATANTLALHEGRTHLSVTSICKAKPKALDTASIAGCPSISIPHHPPQRPLSFPMLANPSPFSIQRLRQRNSNFCRKSISFSVMFAKPCESHCIGHKLSSKYFSASSSRRLCCPYSDVRIGKHKATFKFRTLQ